MSRRRPPLATPASERSQDHGDQVWLPTELAMDKLQGAIDASEWDDALETAASLGVPASYVHKLHFLRAPDPAVLALVDDDPRWTAQAVLSAQAYDKDLPKQAWLVEIGLEATERWVEQIPGLGDLLKEEGKRGGKEREGALAELKRLVQSDAIAKDACRARWAMLEQAKRWDTYCQVYGVSPTKPVAPSKSTSEGRDGSVDDDDVDADAWGALDEDVEPVTPAPALPSDAIPFSVFSRTDPTALACQMASTMQLKRAIILHHKFSMGQLAVASSIPLFADPSDADYGPDLITLLPRPAPEHPPDVSILESVLQSGIPQGPRSVLDPSRIRGWYETRIETIDKEIGAIDLALSYIQHGASLGVTGLELLGEDLSLLSKLLYDSPAAPILPPALWTLDYWRSQEPLPVVRAYLTGSSPATLETEVRRLVLPYLSVVEARLERSGKATPEVAGETTPRLLREWALSSCSSDLPLFAAFVNASSPTRRASDRFISDDADLARLGLAVLYATKESDAWEAMSAIFECMPAFPNAAPPVAELDGRQILLTALSSIEPSSPPASLYKVFMALRTGELAASLDSLDDDLATAELLARWNVPIPLRDLVVRVRGSAKEQAKLALRMARQEGGTHVESEDEWMALMEAMANAAEKGKVFEMLGREEVVKIFFGGLLSSGKFRLAKVLFAPSSGQRPVDPHVQEELVLATSRELYDNAESGNQNVGEMKLALECLTAAPTTPAIRRQRDLIEATSRLASFKLYSQPGVPMTPLQIRLTPDKLTLILELLRSNPDAYQHPDMMLDLVAKLGLQGDKLAEIRTLALVASAAISAGDSARATEVCERMVAAVGVLRRSRAPAAADQAEQAAEMTWRTCAQLGQLTAGTKELRLRLLGHALVLCPPSEISTLLASWRQADDEPADRPKLDVQHPSAVDRVASAIGRSHSPFGGLTESGVTSDAAGRAARTLGRAAALFPFGHRPRSSTPTSVGGLTSPALPGPAGAGLELPPQLPSGQAPSELHSAVPGERHADRLTSAISNRFTSGVGWLIGADAQ